MVAGGVVFTVVLSVIEAQGGTWFRTPSLVAQGNDLIIGRAPKNGVAFEVVVRRDRAVMLWRSESGS